MENRIKFHMGNCKESDCGAVGKAFEIACREYTYRRKLPTICAKQGKVDAKISYKADSKKISRATIEYKSACGELGDCMKAQYIGYCPTIDIEKPAETQCYIFTREEWRDLLQNYGGRGQLLKVDSQRGTLHFQSFYCETRPKASKPIANYLWESCYNQPTLEEFISELRGL